ncbi:DNA polymerase III subunit gamma/tau [Thiomicrospira sp. WB1]|uniref:DNA polymerase III subunit gamma/tau n=1 Tax=Thiomicrospira sp. WB1 TaxID=1685380 RepID=UPI00074B1ADA|nr:DNA polymerase III subunit gamma/tau [Thiomicrospira sp. WB1]KUJ71502.1 hypothetical protein AVO41_08240 [Thiomicrospira sp. WB1]
MNATALARKWRPKQFSELVGQAHVMQALSNALDQQRLHHAYLFTGTRGVGKTTIARIFAKALNCEQGIGSQPCGQCSVCQSVDQGRFVDLIEVDAASKTKVEDTRELLDNVQYAPVQGRYKVYLVDEVHMLSKSSFNALLKTLEEPPEHVKFLLATTDPHKLPATVLSRCLQFNLMRLTPTQITQHLAQILAQETVPFEEAALQMLAKSADGSARDSLSLLDQAIAYGAGEVKADAVKAMLGLVDQQFTQRLLQALADESVEAIKTLMQELAQMGIDYEALMGQLIEALHQLSLWQILNSAHEASVLDEAFMATLAQTLAIEQVQAWYQIALMGQQDMQLAPDVRIGFEMALLRMLAFEPGLSVSASQSIQAAQATERVPAKKPSAPERGESSPATTTQPTNEAVEPAAVSTTSTSQSSGAVTDAGAKAAASLGQDKNALLALMESGDDMASASPEQTSDAPASGSMQEPVEAPVKAVQPAAPSQQPSPNEWDQLADQFAAMDESGIDARDSEPRQDLGVQGFARTSSSQSSLEGAVQAEPHLPEAGNHASASPLSEPVVQQVAPSPVEEAPLPAATDAGASSTQTPWSVTEWEALMQQLDLTGLSAELARHCVCLGQDGRELRLSLDPAQPQARSEMAWMQLEEQVKAMLGVKLTFESYGGVHETPASAKKQRRADREAAAKASIEQDPMVSLLKERLQMTVLDHTVRPKES